MIALSIFTKAVEGKLSFSVIPAVLKIFGSACAPATGLARASCRVLPAGSRRVWISIHPPLLLTYARKRRFKNVIDAELPCHRGQHILFPRFFCPTKPAREKRGRNCNN
jgi:hypothetical protein